VVSEIPTFRHGKNTKVYFSASDLSVYFNSASVSNAIDMGETSTFGSGAKTYVAGLSDSKASLGGLWDGTALAVDDILSAALAVEDRVFTYMPEGGVLGRACYIGVVDAASYEVTSPVADVVSISAELQADGGLFRGVVLAADTVVASATTTNGTNVDNGALTSNGGIATLHATANSRSATTPIKVQHSVDNSVWVDLVTFASVGIGVTAAERAVVAPGTTVNRHLRAQSVTTGTGSITYSVAFARR
jgi:hypothetical protein